MKIWAHMASLFSIFTFVGCASILDVPSSPTDTVDVEKQKEWAQLELQQERIVQDYVAASLWISKAQIAMADALELKSQAEKLKIEADALRSDSVIRKKQLQSYTKVSKRTNALIQEKLAENIILNNAQRMQFLQGTLTYSQGIAKTNDVIDDMQPFAKSVRQQVAQQSKSVSQKIKDREFMEVILMQSKANRMLEAKFSVALYVAKSMPQLFVDHMDTLGKISTFAQTNQMKLPSDATKMLANYDGVKVEQRDIFTQLREFASNVFKGKNHCKAPNGSSCLTIETQPANAKIILPDIRPRYSSGMILKNGRYRIKVIAPGYHPEERTVNLDQNNQEIVVNMTPQS